MVVALLKQGELAHHALHPRRERARREDGQLRLAHARRRDHLHGLGDLLGRLDRL